MLPVSNPFLLASADHASNQQHHIWFEHTLDNHTDLLFAGKISPLKRLKPSADSAPQSGVTIAAAGATGNADDAEVARRLHEQLNGPESPTNAPLVRHITRQRKAPTFYKPEVQHNQQLDT